MEEVNDLDRINILHRLPVTRSTETICSDANSVISFEEFYDSNECMEMPRWEEMMKLEAFSLDELRSAMRYMKNR